ncbi:Nuclear transport factor 2 [Colletotrichum tropicale]|nr:Nuclear transport factor 2 [Colletotrichum tropicale]
MFWSRECPRASAAPRCKLIAHSFTPQSLPFEKVKHQVSTLDAQPSLEGGIVILVTGQLLVDEEQRPMNYTQAFQLMRDPTGNYFVFNDLFKLVYG